MALRHSLKSIACLRGVWRWAMGNQVFFDRLQSMTLKKLMMQKAILREQYIAALQQQLSQATTEREREALISEINFWQQRG